MNSLPVLSLITFTPLLGVAALAAWRAADGATARRVALGTSLLVLAQMGALLARFDTDTATLQFVERVPWIPSLGVDYFLGLDGLNVLPLLLTVLLVPFSLAIADPPRERPRLYCALILLLECGLLGNFTALNFLHWFLYWEVGLIPAWFLVRLWGGPGSRASADRFFLFTLAGSVALLIAFQGLFLAARTLDLIRLAELGRAGDLAGNLAATLAWTGLDAARLGPLLFLAAFTGLAVKVPLVPLHTWLPDTYAEAPTPVTLLLTGALSKMGVYGFIRLLAPIFPHEIRALLGPLLLLTVVTIVFPALVALAQTDLKRILAYSSINHLGYCLLGLLAVAEAAPASPAWDRERSAALAGTLVQLFNHGINAGALFAGVAMIERRSGGRLGLEDFGGLRAIAPRLSTMFGIALFASLGLPGLSGFIGEFLVFKGAFALVPGAAILAVPGLFLTALFLLTLYQKVFNGPANPAWAGFPDLSRREWLLLAPAVLLLVLPGVLPQLLLRWVNATVVVHASRIFPGT
ncbi:MAG: NADH-quinone oxidoreductase subunit M [Verrucomicrobiae bacterium]|nr:NADH-quinone oxidoreductase subunit M [Verrucomicrobiae bacterium]